MTHGHGAGADLRARPGLAASFALSLLLLTGCAGGAETRSEPSPSASPPAAAHPAPSTGAEVPDNVVADPVPVLGVGVRPASVRIPALDLDEPLVQLGIKPDGTMGVPADWDAVGWFSEGGKPGGRGPTVIAGHVDSVTAPAVFSRLRELVVGDVVEVTDVDGVVHGYEVDEVADFPKDRFPTARVFGALPSDEVRLITCGGYFDPEAASYVENRVVFASRLL